MRPIFLAALLVSQFAHAVANAAPVISNILELVALPESEIAKVRLFDLHGTVTYVGNIDNKRKSIVLDDGKSGVFLQCVTLPVKTGDCLHVKGYTQRYPTGERHFLLSETVKTGSGKLPSPCAVTADDLLDGKANYKYISIQAPISDAFVDEIDQHYVYCTLRPDNQCVYAVCRTEELSTDLMSELIGANVRLTGVYVPNARGHRRFVGNLLHFNGSSSISIVNPAVSNPYQMKKLEDVLYTSPQSVRELGFRRICGTVLATWNGNHLLVHSELGQFHRITLKTGQPLPPCGSTVTVGGLTETDLYLINLTHALCAIEQQAVGKLPEGRPVPAERILYRDRGPQIDTEYYGRVVTLRGSVVKPNADSSGDTTLYLDCQTHVVPVNVSSLPAAGKRFEAGSVVDATGVCLMDVDNWHPDEMFPKIRGFLLVARTPEDLRLVSRPPWWTPARILLAAGILLVLLVVIGIWNLTLNRLVRKRSRELLHSRLHQERAEIKTDERTRLAVELHDSLSQNLAGIACQLSATRQSIPLGSAAITSNLSTAMRMLTSSRTELKRCLFDLRGDALETPDFETAIRKTLKPLEGPAAFLIKFHIHRAKIDESTSHAALCIIRELVSNAIRHGNATEIKIAGSLDNGKLLFSVSDNGTGFDPSKRPGAVEGHFGLQGIRERTERHGGTLSINSAVGHGTHVRISIPLLTALKQRKHG